MSAADARLASTDLSQILARRRSEQRGGLFRAPLLQEIVRLHPPQKDANKFASELVQAMRIWTEVNRLQVYIWIIHQSDASTILSLLLVNADFIDLVKTDLSNAVQQFAQPPVPSEREIHLLPLLEVRHPSAVLLYVLKALSGQFFAVLAVNGPRSEAIRRFFDDVGAVRTLASLTALKDEGLNMSSERVEFEQSSC